jgi:bifunctional ADP-heptose synthase (sugar kinase/adenylyltransferase)
MQEEWYLGAAGLIARQLKALGTDVTFVVPLGDDELAQRCRDTIRADNIELVELDVEERPTYQKARYIVENKKILKVNHGRYSPISAQVTERMLDTLDDIATGKDGLIAADFGYGLFGPELVSGLNQIVQSEELSYYIDVSSGGASNLLSFKSPTAAFPSEEELRFAFGDQESGLSHLAVNYFDATDAQNLILTLGKQGVVVFYPPVGDVSDRASPTEYLPALRQHSVDPVGAGDIFLSGYVGFDLLDMEPAHSLYLGAVLAALHINRMGNTPLRAGEFQRVFSGQKQVR